MGIFWMAGAPAPYVPRHRRPRRGEGWILACYAAATAFGAMLLAVVVPPMAGRL
jgi:hypothetical protein